MGTGDNINYRIDEGTAIKEVVDKFEAQMDITFGEMMKFAENDKMYSREEALSFLDNR